MPICLQCTSEILRKRSGSKDLMKFCGRSCSTTYRNIHSKISRKKIPTVPCSGCGRATHPENSTGICRSCKKLSNISSRNLKSIGDLREEYSTTQFHAKIRQWAREEYLGLYICFECGYFLHVDICHIKPVADYDKSVLIGDVNSNSNLVALCKTHHWEFDNSYLILSF